MSKKTARGAREGAAPLPRVGDVVALTWVDSGMSTLHDDRPHGDLKLATCVSYGLVVFVDDWKTVLVTDHGVDKDGLEDYHEMMRNVIWTKSIRGVEVLRKDMVKVTPLRKTGRSLKRAGKR